MQLLSSFSNFRKNLVTLILLTNVALIFSPAPSLAVGREATVPDLQFQPIRPPHSVTLREAVAVALRNYPKIAEKQFKLRAAKANIALAKTQYLPNLNADFQEDAVTNNRISANVMNNVSGFDTVPVNGGPSSRSSNMKLAMNSLQGLNFNWLIVDGGLRKANDNVAYADARTARADLALTKLDVAFDAADAFLDAVAAKQVINSTTAALDHMEAAKLRAKTLVSEGLKPGVEAANWDYEVSKAKIGLLKAQEDTELALVDLSEKMGVASHDLDVISNPLVRRPLAAAQQNPFNLQAHPLALFKTAEIDRWRAKEILLDKAWRPHVWINSSLWGLGNSQNTTINPIKPVAGGVLPQTFNYMIGATYSFPFMEYFPLKAQKDMARSNELAAKADFDLAMQILERKDARARIILAKTKRIADETPTLVESAKVREINELKRYSTGLTNMVSLAAAEKALAEAQVEDAIAQVEVWRAILKLSYVQGDLRPFLQLVEIVENSTGENK